MRSAHVGMGLGIWYIVAPFVWGYPLGFVVWQDLLIGGAILAVSVAFSMSPGRLNGWLLIAIGAYSMFAPFLHDYILYAQPYWNDLVFGVLTVGTGMAMGAAGIELAGAGASTAETRPRT